MVSHDYVLATGTVAQVERTFATTIRQFRSGSTTFLANTAAPLVPAALPVLSVLGLNTFQRFSGPAHAASPSASLGEAGALVSNAAAALPNVFAITPQSLWSVYQLPAAYRGAGQTVAVFGFGVSAGAVSDLAQFERDHQLPSVPVTVRTVGPGPFTDTSNAVEWDIDTQPAAGMAPDASGLTLYFGADLADASVEAMLTTWVNDPSGPAQADASFGECERTPLDPILEHLPGNISQDPSATVGVLLGNNLEPVAEQTLRQATMEGRTLFSGAGDLGSSCPVVSLPGIGTGNGVLNQVVPLTSYPASSSYAVAVGGTVLYTTGRARVVSLVGRDVGSSQPERGGAGYGFANETLYRLGKNPATRSRDFFDVTLGTNGLYTALPGWDYVSGFGTPRLGNLIADAAR